MGAVAKRWHKAENETFLERISPFFQELVWLRRDIWPYTLYALVMIAASIAIWRLTDVMTVRVVAIGVLATIGAWLVARARSRRYDAKP